ncbi:hypothetical protein SODALDRAFT_211647 [Sodiomyces alkalinus F11]|uniref:Uncharacterized protein n=1 Tax=Sodiomyces alkalinus (strain CBS 110278 / VKM F-3762 / F11) TaxID=1314773 RepID=A0A3N2PR13_SODAK|nr:hypothetical protein SODALDRAFT_211647 [Sodiomyces alkalinus F11]ROT36953.1 hypothetical protein SODALDRAFT_211647 [Sodiomyces alkalinus F11]
MTSPQRGEASNPACLTCLTCLTLLLRGRIDIGQLGTKVRTVQREEKLRNGRPRKPNAFFQQTLSLSLSLSLFFSFLFLFFLCFLFFFLSPAAIRHASFTPPFFLSGPPLRLDFFYANKTTMQVALVRYHSRSTTAGMESLLFCWCHVSLGIQPSAAWSALTVRYKYVVQTSERLHE